MKEFDYIIAGGGCAGLSLAVHMARSGAFRDKKILLVEKERKEENDRTWCFWETQPSIFEEVVFRKWQKLNYHDQGFSTQLQISPYTYKMIRGKDFYEFCHQVIRSSPNITVYKNSVSHVFSNRKATGIIINGKAILADYVFNSIPFTRPSLKSNEYWLLQHFKGWVIETEEEAFDVAAATLMDFRIPQDKGTAFCYLLPFSSRKALIEYTLFTADLLSDEDYNEGLKNYIENRLGIKSYKITEEEKGLIPMTNARFNRGSHHLIQIGTAGGQTKGSTGYTFRFIQKHSEKIVKGLLAGSLKPFSPSRKFAFYDSVLLNILNHDTVPGHEIFTQIFKGAEAPTVLKFLDNESSMAEDIKIISTLPTKPFFKAALKQML